MRQSTGTLTPAQVDRFAVEFCQPHLKFRTVGKVTGEVILSVLFAAAARISSIHETCGRLAKAPCEETFTAALYPQLTDVNAIKRPGPARLWVILVKCNACALGRFRVYLPRCGFHDNLGGG
jgi:hypothetical protein